MGTHNDIFIIRSPMLKRLEKKYIQGMQARIQKIFPGEGSNLK